MNYKHIVDLITKDSHEIDSLVRDLNKYDESNLPRIYVDLMVSKVKILYLELMMLNKTPDELYKMKLTDPLPEIKLHQASAVVPPLVSAEPPTVGTEPELLQSVIAPVAAPVAKEDKESLKRKREQHFLSTQLKYDSIPDMKSAININDKIWFIKELFQGNIEHYNRTIDQINVMRSIDEVFEFIDENFSWDYDNKTIKKFYEIVYRRFI